MTVYLNGDFVPKEEARLSPDDRGFLFADGVYEVIRIYDGTLFALRPHLDRLARSLRELRINGIDVQKLGDVARRLVQDNHLEQGDAIVYFQVTRGAAPRRHAFPEAGTPPTIYATAYPITPPTVHWEQGAKVILMPDIRWTRCDIKSIALTPNVLANQRAKENGAVEAVFVRDGAVTEGSHANFGAVFNGRLVTYPKSPYILPGITRDMVLGLCRERGIPVEEFPVFEKDLKHADELMLLGTTTEVMPVVQVDHWTVGDGTPGPVTRTLQYAFHAVTRKPPSAHSAEGM